MSCNYSSRTLSQCKFRKYLLVKSAICDLKLNVDPIVVQHFVQNFIFAMHFYQTRFGGWYNVPGMYIFEATVIDTHTWRFEFNFANFPGGVFQFKDVPDEKRYRILLVKATNCTLSYYGSIASHSNGLWLTIQKYLAMAYRSKWLMKDASLHVDVVLGY